MTTPAQRAPRLTNAQKQAAWRERRAAELDRLRLTLRQILTARTLETARAIAEDALAE